ncbi:hypothetical protein O3M35_006670 [Rhynocoris fuscipes]|uniref:Uncharacterized protein n=1 Tax=Rhynocoris fuscipes TaxID=488301 RepID=A0AAW1DEB2_9HEMI
MSDIDNDSSFVYYIYNFCAIYVLLKILYQLCRLTDLYILPKFRQPKDFKSYGQWAVITGSTDGIGKEFAKELASKGVDIYLISRNEQKLQNTAKEIEESFGVKTKYIVADFTDITIYNNIKKDLADIDIGILVNNVGMVTEELEAFSYHSDQLIKNYINVNIASALMMTSVIIPSMISKKKGLIVNISSVSEKMIYPYGAMYISTKAGLSKFGECLSYELSKHNVEVKTLIPGHVSTTLVTHFSNLMKVLSYIPLDLMPSAKIYVQSAIKNLSSISNTSCGYFYHELELMCIKILPVRVLEIIMNYLHGIKKM